MDAETGWSLSVLRRGGFSFSKSFARRRAARPDSPSEWPWPCQCILYTQVVRSGPTRLSRDEGAVDAGADAERGPRGHSQARARYVDHTHPHNFNSAPFTQTTSGLFFGFLGAELDFAQPNIPSIVVASRAARGHDKDAYSWHLDPEDAFAARLAAEPDRSFDAPTAPSSSSASEVRHRELRQQVKDRARDYPGAVGKTLAPNTRQRANSVPMLGLERLRYREPGMAWQTLPASLSFSTIVSGRLELNGIL